MVTIFRPHLNLLLCHQLENEDSQTYYSMYTLFGNCLPLGVDHKINHQLKNTTMKKNMGSTDRVVRIILAAIFAVLYFTGTVPGTLGLVLVIVGAVFLLTSLVSFCPLYAIVGLNTCSTKKTV